MKARVPVRGDGVVNLPENAAPRRKSNSGPNNSQPQNEREPRKSFVVTSVYNRKDEIMNTLSELQSNLESTVTYDDNVNILSQIETTKNILCCKYTEDLDSIAAGFPDGCLRIFHRETSQTAHILHDDESKSNSGTITAIKHRPVSKHHPSSNTLTCTYTNGCVKCWDYNLDRCVYTIREKRQTLSLAYHPRLPKFVTGGDDGKVYLYDEETRTQERIFAASDNPELCDGHTSRVFAACFSPRSQFEVITGGWDNTVQFWDVRQPYSVRHLQDVHICAEGIDISRNGKEIVTAAWQKKDPLKIWDYNNLKLLQTVKPDSFNSMLYCARYVDGNFFLTGGCDPNLLRLVDARSMMSAAIIRGFQGGVYCIDIGPQRKNKRINKGKPEMSVLPVSAFVSGKKIVQVDFA